MCGIAGIVIRSGAVDRQLLHEMTDCLAHRGPEARGLWFASSNRVGFGHRRLAIIDLSTGGSQPMASPDGMTSITFNGELYNYLELREELKKLGHIFLSVSDTEVLLHSYLEWGVDCLSHLDGMFAFGVWDERKQMFFAARDRLGEKPLKYHFDGNTFLFASEVKAILKAKKISSTVDWSAIDLAFSFRYVPAPLTGHKDIFKLPAGHYLTLKNGDLQIKKYWDAEQKLVVRSEEKWKKDFWGLFLDSVRHRMVSDVPLGAFLSGGIDSTSVVAAMREVSNGPISSFVVGFDDSSEDRKFARIAADHFKTDHHEIEISDIDFPSVVTKLMEYYDEPFFDQSSLPSLLINEHVKKFATVALSGDGGDELFGGYPSYGFAKFLSKFNFIPRSLTKNIPFALGFNKDLQYRSEIVTRDIDDAYTEYYSLWKTSLPLSKIYITKSDLYSDALKQQIQLGSSTKLMAEWMKSEAGDFPNNAMLADIRGRLPDGYLAKVDFASMASAVEVRTPFLDYRLVEHSQQLPSYLKLKNGGKYIWKEIVKNKLPKSIIERKKMGFALPLHRIIMNELRPVVEGLVLAEGSHISEMFNRKTIMRLWKDHCEGRADYSNHIWSLLILELWLRHYPEK
jgi:asparagine synthase (glutamine-hydrolysing)